MIQFNVGIVFVSRAGNVVWIGRIIREKAKTADNVAQFSKKKKSTG
jgi:hypothetical protein